MRSLISTDDLVVMAIAAGVCLLPASHFLVLQCFGAVISANMAFFLWRLLRPSLTLQPADRAVK